MIILRNSYYSSPYYGGRYGDLEERLFGAGKTRSYFMELLKNTPKEIRMKSRSFNAWKKLSLEEAGGSAKNYENTILTKAIPYYESLGFKFKDRSVKGFEEKMRQAIRIKNKLEPKIKNPISPTQILAEQIEAGGLSKALQQARQIKGMTAKEVKQAYIENRNLLRQQNNPPIIK